MIDLRWVFMVAAAVSTALGFAWLALAMETHWKQVFGLAELGTATRRKLRVLGAITLMLSLALCLLADQPSMAMLVWMMLLALGVVLVALVLTCRARWLRCLWCRRA